ncbi:hypothetical protein CROQUDRAFT_87017 [Cronartium quercuum f. sp. fusiforme G11]|uniref:Uncharacterized protein n=1 Tax=Cronartium quercuum f. sp. fusiforme G11 TaxID=708437 RepID=A0A9P6TFZ7_9BASI|nr:hypothetical protein CROQUDRAFT_87017 [Cronartium quercuum f. sp. fusiforme G11]
MSNAVYERHLVSRDPRNHPIGSRQVIYWSPAFRDREDIVIHTPDTKIGDTYCQ